MSDEEILSVNVGDSVGSEDGVPAALDQKKPSALLRYVPWKNQAAREVVQADVPRVLEEAIVLSELCHTPTGVYTGANAVAHNQITYDDPLRFFVSSSGEIIVNPEIISHTKVPVDSIEACTSFPEQPPKKLQRYHVVTAKFQQITPEKELSEPREERFSGPEARVFQHEIAHLNGHSIYDETVSPEDAVGSALLTVK